MSLSLSIPSFGQINCECAAFRSNLLVPLMNVGIEVPVSERVSLEADFYSPWVMRRWIDKIMPVHKYCFQFVGGDVGCRFWTHYRLCGHSVGVVASGGIYDFERDWKGQQGEFVFIGLDYLYGLPLGKGGVHIEFNLGAGYGIDWYQNYKVRYEGGKLIDDGGRRKCHRLVPIRLAVSIAIPVFWERRVESGIAEGVGNE